MAVTSTPSTPLEEFAREEFQWLLNYTDWLLAPGLTLIVQKHSKRKCGGQWLHATRELTLLVGQRATQADVAMVLCHELAHACLPVEEDHGDKWRSVYVHLVLDAYGVHPRHTPLSTVDLDDQLEIAIEAGYAW